MRKKKLNFQVELIFFISQEIGILSGIKMTSLPSWQDAIETQTVYTCRSQSYQRSAAIAMIPKANLVYYGV